MARGILKEEGLLAFTKGISVRISSTVRDLSLSLTAK